ncbi:aldehyde dehydrogenase family protein [soil metagenome]
MISDLSHNAGPTPLPHIPILRQGVEYRSLDINPITRVNSDEPVGEMSMANAGLLKRDLLSMKKARHALREIPAADLVRMTKAAGDYFLHEKLPLGDGLQNPDDYLAQLHATSGLPHALIRMNMKKLHQLFTEMDEVLNGLSRGLALDVLDEGIGEQAGVPVSFSPVTDSLGVVLPSNSPAVNALWMPAILMKIPVVLKPGREEPWTPWRIIQAFLKAGVPKEAFSFYPTSHEGSQAIIRKCGRVMVFGDDKTVGQYANDRRVEVHGTGHTKILVGEDRIDRWQDYLDVLVESVSANSGRSCINASTIVVPRHGDAIARALAEKLAEIRPLPAEDPDARLSGFANSAFADYIDAALSAGLKEPGARDVSAEVRGDGQPRRVQRDGMDYLLPTVVRLDSFDHALANREFLFPFVQVIEMPQADMLERLGYSLVVTAITDDPDWIPELLDCPDIERLNVGAFPTSRIQWNQPHEGNLFEFLYKRRAIHVAHA